MAYSTFESKNNSTRDLHPVASAHHGLSSDDASHDIRTSFSVESFARSFTRAAAFPAPPIVTSQHRPSFVSFSRSRRPSEVSNFTIIPSRMVNYADSSYRNQYTAERTPQSNITDSYLSILAQKYATADSDASESVHEGVLKPSVIDCDALTPLLAGQVITETDPTFDRAHHSNVTQTVFNTVNLILGMGILGLPLAFKRAGLVIGLLCFLWSAFTTLWTGKLITKCLTREKQVVSFGELAHVTYGYKARFLVMVLVTIELTASSIGQILLFSTSIGALFGGVSLDVWKVISGIFFIPLTFVPLRFLGTLSAMSVLCFFTIAGILVSVGIANVQAPGSLHQPASMAAFPPDWQLLPTSIGMILSAWGGHTVFPELYRDMRRPERFFSSVKYSYDITVPLYLLVGLIGYAMFGNNLTGPVSSELVALSNTPAVIKILIVALMVLVPISKIPLNIFPLSTAIELACGIHPSKYELDANGQISRTLSARLSTVAIRVMIGIMFVSLAIIFPEFDQVMSVLGVVAGLLIAVILPILFYLAVFGDEIQKVERVFCWTTIVFAACLASGTTVCNALP